MGSLPEVVVVTRLQPGVLWQLPFGGVVQELVPAMEFVQVAPRVAEKERAGKVIEIHSPILLGVIQVFPHGSLRQAELLDDVSVFDEAARIV